MSLRIIIVLAAFLAFTAVFIRAEEEPENQSSQESDSESETSEEIEADTRNPALAIAVRVLATAFRWAAKHCLQEAAHQCKHTWKHAHQLVNCAKHFLEANKGRCAIGG
ncbi:hypothetical protein QAD02_010256 [Eretmocerus hayati]|uniref:Uncharacterized protein n=1 Tax=Eretmocerus hayati TaxID=131215 RepID=A0ACC2NCC0_9HYME|nr:hypothetical protein QAD02_010256 [Eretmocerus hayati]